MRGEAKPQPSWFSAVNVDERVPRSHPRRQLRVLVDGVLASRRVEP